MFNLAVANVNTENDHICSVCELELEIVAFACVSYVPFCVQTCEIFCSSLCSEFGTMAENGAWAQLVSTTDVEMEHIPLTANKITIGRNRGMTVVFHSLVCFQDRHFFLIKSECSVINKLVDLSH